MRILQLHAAYREQGGEDSVVEAERRLLTDAGHEVFQYIVPNPTGTATSASALAGSLWNVPAARRVARLARQCRPDVVHVHNTWFALSPSVLAAVRSLGLPVIMTVHNYRLACANSLLLRSGSPCEKCLDHTVLAAVRHGCYRDSRPLSAVVATNIAVHRLAGTWRRYVDRFIVLSEFAQTRLRRTGIPEAQMVLGSNFTADPGPRAAPPSSSDEVLFVGRLSVEKGVEVLLEAWRRAAPPGLRLVVAGAGPMSDRLSEVAPPGVEFLGRIGRDEVDRRLAGARALVLPSIWYEGQPMTALEGLAAGTPLVMSDIGGLAEILGDSGGGWLARPDDPDHLGAALSALADGPRTDIGGTLARQRYLDAFTPAAAVERLTSLYLNVLERAA